MRCLLFLACSGLLFSATLDWQRAFQGNRITNINAIASDPDGNVYLAGSTTSTDLPVKNAAQTQNRGTLIIVSDDGGQTWSPTGYIPEISVTPPVKLPLAAPVLLTLGVSGIYRSTDDGQNWATAFDVQAKRAQVGYVDSIAYDARDPSVVYVSASGGVLKSTDAGSTWTLLTSGLTAGGCCLGGVLAVDPIRAGRLYYSLEGRAYVSKDSGATWSSIPIPDNLRNPRVVADPVIPDAVYLYSYEGLYRSTNAGVSWQRLPLPPTLTLYWVVPHPSLAGRVYARTAEALLRSDDAGMTWRALAPPSVDPRNAETYLAVQAGKPDFVLVSGQSDSSPPATYYSSDAGQTWRPLGVNRLLDFSFDPSRPNRIYAAGTPTSDAFVAKLDPSGEIVYLTYLGGQGNDSATAIAVGQDGSVYIGGTSQSPDFPGTKLRLYNGSAPSLFAAKLDARGSLIYVSLLSGGGFIDSIGGVAADASGHLYVTGAGGRPRTGFVDRFSPDGSAVEFSTSLDPGVGPITLNASGQAWVVSGTTITKLDASGATSTNTQLPIFPVKIVADGEGNVYGIAAVAPESPGPPVTPGAFQTSINFDCPNSSGGLFSANQRPLWMTDSYVFKLSPDLSTTMFATFLGGDCRETPTDISLADDNSVWIAGTTYSDVFPLVDPMAGPPPPEVAKPFLSHLDATGSHLLFSTFLETSLVDHYAQQIPAIAAALGGSVYVSGNSPLNNYYGLSGPALLWKVSPSPTLPPFTITRVGNAYTHSSTGIAPLEIVEVIVPGLVPSQSLDVGLSPTGGAPLVLGIISISFNGIPARMLAVDPGRIVCITPAELAGSPDATVRVKSGDLVAGDFEVSVQRRDLAFFPQVRNQDGSLNTPDNPAQAGSTVSFFVTGAGLDPAGALQLGFVLYGPRADVTLSPLEGFVSGIYEIKIAAPVSGTYQVYLYDTAPQTIGSILPAPITLYVSK